ncbi:MAG: type I-U CRISPR-associated protein Csx17 [Vicinamibacterales bacterium]
MTKVHVHDLTGLKPDVLAGYLGGIGVLRLLADQKDAKARGFWRNECFTVVTRLDEHELTHFFLNEYAPTPILAPWNGGGGFLDTEADEDEDTVSAQVSLLDTLIGYTASRFAELRQAIAQARGLIPPSLTEARAQRDRLTHDMRELRARIRGLTPGDPEWRTLTEALSALSKRRDLARKRVDEVKEDVKADLLRRVAGTWGARAREWFDACVILGSDGLPGYACHLGSGGNEGNQDYTVGFQRNLTLLFRPDGTPSEGSVERLMAALFGQSAPVLARQAAGQFFPGRAGGPNMGNGFEGSPRVNPWEFVLMLEGAVALVAGISRRGEADPARVSSPFWVEAAAAGFASASDREEAPRGEQWLPLWSQPARYAEIVELIREGRAQVGRQQTASATDLVRATARLGVARGIEAMQRFAYLKRYGRQHLAVSAGRFPVRSRSHQALLEEVAPWIHQLVGWARQTRDNNVPASLAVTAKRTLDALFSVCRREASPDDWRALLISLGEAEFALLRSGKDPARRPLPLLSAGWLTAVDDGTPRGRCALRLAVALASQHGSCHDERGNLCLEDPVRHHFMPLDRRDPARPRFKLDQEGRPLRDPEVVCKGHCLVVDAIALVRRRSLWARMAGKDAERVPRLPLDAAPYCEATLEEVGAWIRGEVPDDDVLGLARALLALDWSGIPSDRPLLKPHAGGVPEPLHLLFRLSHLPFDVPVTDAKSKTEVAATVRLDPEPLRRLAGGDSDGAIRVAIRCLEASGLRPVFRRAVANPGVAHRLAASLAFPISRMDAARAARIICKPYDLKDVGEEPGVQA